MEELRAFGNGRQASGLGRAIAGSLATSPRSPPRSPVEPSSGDYGGFLPQIHDRLKSPEDSANQSPMKINSPGRRQAGSDFKIMSKKNSLASPNESVRAYGYALDETMSAVRVKNVADFEEGPNDGDHRLTFIADVDDEDQQSQKKNDINVAWLMKQNEALLNCLKRLNETEQMK